MSTVIQFMPLPPLLFLLALVTATACVAEAFNHERDGRTIWEAGIDGVRVEWAPDGAFSRLFSRISHPVSLGDRAAISKAQTIAEEKAKAAIVRFINQQVTTHLIVKQIQTDIGELEQRSAKGAGGKIAGTLLRKLMESVTEVTTSVASGHLRGVVVLERGYDPKNDVAWVEVGISHKTLDAAKRLGNALSGDNKR